MDRDVYLRKDKCLRIVNQVELPPSLILPPSPAGFFPSALVRRPLLVL